MKLLYILILCLLSSLDQMKKERCNYFGTNRKNSIDFRHIEIQCIILRYILNISYRLFAWKKELTYCRCNYTPLAKNVCPDSTYRTHWVFIAISLFARNIKSKKGSTITPFKKYKQKRLNSSISRSNTEKSRNVHMEGEICTSWYLASCSILW